MVSNLRSQFQAYSDGERTHPPRQSSVRATDSSLSTRFCEWCPQKWLIQPFLRPIGLCWMFFSVRAGSSDFWLTLYKILVVWDGTGFCLSYRYAAKELYGRTTQTSATGNFHYCRRLRWSRYWMAERERHPRWALCCLVWRDKLNEPASLQNCPDGVLPGLNRDRILSLTAYGDFLPNRLSPSLNERSHIIERFQNGLSNHATRLSQTSGF